MNERHPNWARTDDTWQRVNDGDYSTALDDIADDVIVENGPGAGPWRYIKGKDAYACFVLDFLPLFGDAWRQQGTCVYADERVSIALVRETGTHTSGQSFDNLAVWVSRFRQDGQVDRQWTVDLDQEHCEQFWTAANQ